MKHCNVCDTTKPLSEFNKKGDRYQSKCRECQSEWYRNYYKTVPNEKNRVLANNAAHRDTLRGLIRQRKSVPCMDCKVSYPYYVMDFDHRDPSQKSKDVGKMVVAGSPVAQVIAEMDKCDVVCANCHRIRTHSPLV